jgi:ribosomal protein L11 methyltransferase
MPDGAPFGAAPRPGELWRVSFGAPAVAMPALLEPLEEMALAVSIFEQEVDENEETASWRIDMLFEMPPDLERLGGELEQLCSRHGFRPGALALEAVVERDWLEATAMRAPPVQVGRFFVHGAHAAGEVPAGCLGIQIEAGLAFGSGEHATTQGCLEALDGIAHTHRYRRVLDMGCGSAVLAIAAAKRRPCHVVAADNDPVAVRVAAENAALNGVASQMELVASDGYRASLVRRRAPYDLVLSNILADPLCAMAGDLAGHLAPGGRAVLSGFLNRHVGLVADAHRRHGLRVREEILKGPWATLVLEAPRRLRRPLARRRQAHIG